MNLTTATLLGREHWTGTLGNAAGNKRRHADDDDDGGGSGRGS